jgi:acetamidase/formamidase
LLPFVTHCLLPAAPCSYPGVLTQHPTGTEDASIRGKFVVPANLHIGNIGLAPKFKPNEAVNSIPPLPTGGNMDNRRVGKGATLYLPVQVRAAAEACSVIIADATS